jgi:hypothetical protein
MDKKHKLDFEDSQIDKKHKLDFEDSQIDKKHKLDFEDSQIDKKIKLEKNKLKMCKKSRENTANHKTKSDKNEPIPQNRDFKGWYLFYL